MPAAGAPRQEPISAPPFRRPRRLSITIPELAHRRLLERSLREGRSLSNLAAYLLEQAIDERGA